MKKKNILFISSWFPNKIEPTNGNFVQRHAEAVSKIHQVEILHSIGDSAQRENFVFDERVINGIRTLIVYYKKTKNPILNFSRRMVGYQKGFTKLEKPDLVHANILQSPMFFALYLKRKYKIPFVVTEHWSGFLGISQHKLSKPNLFVAKKIAENASYILPVSRYLQNDMQKLNFKNRMSVIENVVDTDLFSLKNEKKGKFIFLHISNLIKLKNPQKIISAAIRLNKDFPNFELQIGGDGDIEVLNKQIRENNAESYIKTFPMIGSKEVAEKMQHSDCFVLFSDYESFGCVLLESLSTGTPLIATKVGAIPEIINEKVGILISKDEGELYNSMKRVVLKNTDFDPPEKLHQYVTERYSMQIIAKKFDRIYNEVLK